jgi:hypothetical protein
MKPTGLRLNIVPVPLVAYPPDTKLFEECNGPRRKVIQDCKTVGTAPYNTWPLHFSREYETARSVDERFLTLRLEKRIRKPHK